MLIPSAEQSANQIVDVIHTIAENSQPIGIRIGLVLKFEPPEIQIAVDDMVLEKEQLYLDQFLLTGYQRDTSGTTSMTNVSGGISLGNVDGHMTLTGAEV